MADSPTLGRATMQSNSPTKPPPRRPSLLPAFGEPDPFSSSPGLPRPTSSSLKRKFDHLAEHHYPTPIPTSSTAFPISSPPPRQTRPGLHRAVSTLSERAPLGDLPTLDLPANGEPLLMGRSSNSSDYQLSANRAISRVHVKAVYYAPEEGCPTGKVEVECLGWNGCRVHCRGEIIELMKGKSWSTGRFGAQIIVDVQDTRVMVVWPKEQSREPVSVGPGSPWAMESPTKRRSVGREGFAARPPSRDILASSPPIMPPGLGRPRSPISPTPAANLASTFTSTFHADSNNEGEVQVYVDHSSDEDAPGDPDETPELGNLTPTNRTLSTQRNNVNTSFLSAASADIEELSEHDEENDPIVHSFYASGENILDRLASFQSGSPEQKRKVTPSSPNRQRKPLTSSFGASPRRSTSDSSLKLSPVKNHVINQLAYSRIHSLPLSTIHSNLPAELRAASDANAGGLKTLLDNIPCVGEIPREGKDAAGKLLESEFYYVPEQDTDDMRRDTVTQSLGKTSIRAARKQHKQYYWKRPKH